MKGGREIMLPREAKGEGELGRGGRRVKGERSVLASVWSSPVRDGAPRVARARCMAIAWRQRRDGVTPIRAHPLRSSTLAGEGCRVAVVPLPRG